MAQDHVDFLSSLQKTPAEREVAAALAQARSAAIHWIGLGRKPSGKIRDYLARQGYESSLIAQVLADLMDEGKIDDLHLANRQVKARTGAKAESAQRLAQRLAAQGLTPSAIDQALQDRPAELEQALLAMQGKFGRIPIAGVLTVAQKQKYYRFLMSRGFAGEVCREAIREFLRGIPDHDECIEP